MSKSDKDSNNSNSKKQQHEQQHGNHHPLNEDLEEWIFWVDCPSHTVLVDCDHINNNNDTNTTKTANDATKTENHRRGQKQRVFLRQTQSLPSSTLGTAARSAAASYASSSSSSFSNNFRDTVPPELSPTTPEERAALLASAARDGQSTSNTIDHDGWTLSSPYWTLRSNILLQITFCPAWQALPEYTTSRLSCQNRVWSWCHDCMTFNSNNSSSNSNKQSYIDYYQYTWTAQDILKVEPNSVVVEGVGTCQGLKFHLRPLPEQSLDDNHRQNILDIPPNLQEAWEEHVQRMQDTRNVRETATTTNTENLEVRENHEDNDIPLGPILYVALPKSQMGPPLLWKVEFPALSHPIAVETFTMMEGHLNVPSSSSDSSESPVPTHIFINGYQSWSFSGSLLKGQEQPRPALPNVFSRAFNLGASPPPQPATTLLRDHHFSPRPPLPRPKYMYESDFFTCITSDASAQRTTFPFQNLDERGGPALILGWLAQRQQFGIVQADRQLQDLAMHASADGQILLPQGLASASTTKMITTDWAYAQLLSPHSYDEEPLVHYFHAVAGHNAARPLQNGNLLVGWCSWYHYYENISEKCLKDNFAKLAGMKRKVPMNVSVVDDGYMTAWGDWDSLKPRKFGSTLESVSREIARNHMRPGLWLAPFAADKHSKVSQQHPDWIIRNDRGVAANSASCGRFFYGLDATHPGVRQHVHESIRRAVVDWQFQVLKIDFLYSACLVGNGKYDLSKSRAQAMHMALETIRQAAGPNVFLIGCGCSIASAIGYVDGMRVSADTGPTWDPAFPLPWWDHGTLPCLRSMTRNSLSRAPMGHRWWHNDPDCLLLGESTRLSLEEVASAASVVAMTCGMMLLSDDLTKVSMPRMRILTKIFPMVGATAVVLDLHSTNEGMPSLLRLWATDRYSSIMQASFLESEILRLAQAQSVPNLGHVEATFFARKASFQLNLDDMPNTNERKRSCIHVCEGLGTWTIVSISNWSNKTAVLHVPPPALLPPPPTVFDDDKADTFLDRNDDHELRNGFHAFAFWSSRYKWLPPSAGHSETMSNNYDAATNHHLLSCKLAPHETEIFHIKPVKPDAPQYIGSDLHFSCGKEVQHFEVIDNCVVNIQLNRSYNRVGHIFMYLPCVQTEQVHVTVNNEPGTWIVIGNTPQVGSNGSPRLVGRVIRIMVIVHADESPNDGKIQISY